MQALVPRMCGKSRQCSSRRLCELGMGALGARARRPRVEMQRISLQGQGKAPRLPSEGSRGQGSAQQTPSPGVHSCLVSSSCCPRPAPTSQDAYSEIAYLFAEFFRDLDIVPSDIIAGLVLLRQRQRAKRNAVLDEVSAPPSSRRASPRPSPPLLLPPPRGPGGHHPLGLAPRLPRLLPAATTHDSA